MSFVIFFLSRLSNLLLLEHVRPVKTLVMRSSGYVAWSTQQIWEIIRYINDKPVHVNTWVSFFIET